MKRAKLALLAIVSIGAVVAFFIWQERGWPPHEQSRSSPEAGTGYRERAEVSAKSFMVATANGHASEAAYRIIKQGGNAVDATIAAQLMLNLVEPQSSGIGGGGFALFFDAASQQLKSFDGRETAPGAVSENLFLRENGRALGFGEAVRSGRSIGVPGLIALMETLHKAHGQLPWSALFAPAIERAEAGFKMSARLHRLLVRKGAKFFNQQAQDLFFDRAGTAHPVGWLIKNPALANSFKKISQQGAAGFYQGALAKAIVTTARQAPAVPSRMTEQDLSAYRAVERPAVCGTYRLKKVCGMGPPSAGGGTVAMILSLLEEFDLGQSPTPQALHLIAEAAKLSYADSRFYVADADFIPQPKGFLNKLYLDERRQLIDPGKSIKKAEPGSPPLAEKTQLGEDGTIELGGTSHISIVDRQGNIVSMTSSIEGAFGSGQMVEGFLLNNQLTDFSFKPRDKFGTLIANRVQPLKRPRSSMSPTIVFDQGGKARIVVGSPGGSRIILYVVKALIAHINWGMGPQEAVSFMNFGSRNGPFEIERHPDAARFIAGLEALGQTVQSSVMTSGSQMIVIDDDSLRGGADPRREGVVMGD